MAMDPGPFAVAAADWKRRMCSKWGIENAIKEEAEDEPDDDDPTFSDDAEDARSMHSSFLRADDDERIFSIIVFQRDTL